MTETRPRRYASASALCLALDARARERPCRTGETIEAARRRFAFEAFLRRVPKSGQPLVLKGGRCAHKFSKE
jgi:hypothetical protein